MKGNNTIEINQATMLEAINLWLADQFKSPPVAVSVKASNPSAYDRGFSIAVEAPTSEPDGSPE